MDEIGFDLITSTADPNAEYSENLYFKMQKGKKDEEEVYIPITYEEDSDF